ncbi:MAG TPA: OsmC family peroxiredoxin [Pyrinomonadaceae bacterium]|jgi:lipoyl-dependent peroxiredoxin|nr:OsmC family peroxiredoxin [Pyrinomonadaceae bacterium]
MPDRKATAEWKGNLMQGEGRMKLGSGAFEGKFSFSTRMGDEPGTNPEELIAASLAGCYSMALNATLEKAGTPAKDVRSEAVVHFGKDDNGFAIRSIDLETEADVPGITEEQFRETAEKVKETCPVSKALAAVQINLHAKLIKSTAA